VVLEQRLEYVFSAPNLPVGHLPDQALGSVSLVRFNELQQTLKYVVKSEHPVSFTIIVSLKLLLRLQQLLKVAIVSKHTATVTVMD
jgi:hypothetical protein